MHKVREEPAAQFARETPLLQGTWRRPPSLTTVCNEKNISGGVWFPIKPLSYACPVACGCRYQMPMFTLIPSTCVCVIKPLSFACPVAGGCR